jgi:hypothetical protein
MDLAAIAFQWYFGLKKKLMWQSKAVGDNLVFKPKV